MYDPVKLQFYLEELKELVENLGSLNRELERLQKDKARYEGKMKALLEILKADLGSKNKLLDALEGANLLNEVRPYMEGEAPSQETAPPPRVVRRRPRTTHHSTDLPPLERDTKIRLLLGKYRGSVARITSVQMGKEKDDITYFVYVRRPDGTLARTSVKHSSYQRSWELFENGT